MLKGIIFDFGGVFTKTQPREAVLRHCETELGLARNSLTELLFAGSHWQAVSTGNISTAEYWQYICNKLDNKVPAALEPLKYNPFAYEKLNQRMISLGRRLHRHYKTALLSNATPYLDTLLAEHGLVNIFDVVVNSSRVGLRKPDPRIYKLTTDRLGLLPEQCLFVDDKERNTTVAEALGMRTVVFRSAAQLIRQLRELGIRGV